MPEAPDERPDAPPIECMNHSPRAPSVAVIIPALDEADRLGLCIEGVRMQDYPGDVRILVIDSGSADGTRETAGRMGAAVLELAREEFAHGPARQAAAEKADTELVVFTVADAWPADERWLSELVRPLEDGSVAGSCGIQIPPPGTGVSPLARARAKRRVKIKPRLTRFAGPGEWDASSPRKKRTAAYFDNCTSCIRRSLLTGGFPFPPVVFGEDMFWAQEVLRAGWAIALAPSARVVHQHRDSFRYLYHRLAIDARLCQDRFGYRAAPSLPVLAGRILLSAAQACFVSGLWGPGIPAFRIDMRIALALRDFHAELGGLLGRYVGALPPPGEVPAWRPLRRRLAVIAESVLENARNLQREDHLQDRRGRTRAIEEPR